jgi:hypothetical protein
VIARATTARAHEARVNVATFVARALGREGARDDLCSTRTTAVGTTALGRARDPTARERAAAG